MSKEPDKDTVSKITAAWSKWTGNHYEKIMKQTKMAVLAMLPSLEDLEVEQEHRRAEKLLDKIDQVCFCVQNCFLNENVVPDETRKLEVRTELLHWIIKYTEILILLWFILR
jgi:hypothetical protein